MNANASDYIGSWINDVDETMFNVVSVENDVAITDDGKRYSIMDLDLSGSFSKVRSIIEAPEIANQLGSMGFNKEAQIQKLSENQVLGDLSKIGKSKTTSVVERNQVNESITVRQTPKGDIPDINYESLPITDAVIYDPIRNYIKSAIDISRINSVKIDTLPIVINLKLNFDIISVIKSAMQLGASDIEIIQHILDFINIDVDEVKKSIADSLCEPCDAEVINEHREESQTDILKDELNIQ